MLTFELGRLKSSIGPIFDISCEACKGRFYTTYDPKLKRKDGEVSCPFCNCATIHIEERKGEIVFDIE